MRGQLGALRLFDNGLLHTSRRSACTCLTLKGMREVCRARRAKPRPERPERHDIVVIGLIAGLKTRLRRVRHDGEGVGAVEHWRGEEGVPKEFRYRGAGPEIRVHAPQQEIAEVWAVNVVCRTHQHGRHAKFG